MEISEICAELKRGRLIAYPTDTLYGPGADPFNEGTGQWNSAETTR